MSLKKRINVVLSNGLCIVSAKLRDGTPVVTLFVTDYTDHTRVMFDMEHKRILANRDNIELTAKDIENLCAAIQKEEKKPEKSTATIQIKLTPA